MGFSSKNTGVGCHFLLQFECRSIYNYGYFLSFKKLQRGGNIWSGRFSIEFENQEAGLLLVTSKAGASEEIEWAGVSWKSVSLSIFIWCFLYIYISLYLYFDSIFSWLWLYAAGTKAPILWSPDMKSHSHQGRPWCWERLRAGGEDGNTGCDG